MAWLPADAKDCMATKIVSAGTEDCVALAGIGELCTVDKVLVIAQR
jgi:hypothetical protein